MRATITCASLVFVATQVAHAGARFIHLGDDPSGLTETEATAVSSDGSTLVGRGRIGDDYQLIQWRWDEGLTLLGDPTRGQGLPTAAALSADGSVVVGTYNSRAFRWTADHGLSPLTDACSTATGISDDGTIITGMINDVAWPNAYRWTEADGPVRLNGVNAVWGHEGLSISGDGSTIVGYGVDNADSSVAVYWRDGLDPVALPYLSGQFAHALAAAVSADGSTIVGWNTSGEIPHPMSCFRWTAETGTMPLDMPGTSPLRITADGGTIVGGGGGRALIWDATNGRRDLQNVLMEDYGLDLSQWQLWEATDISADGSVIVGRGFHQVGGEWRQEAWAALLPEPGSLMLLMLGWMGLMPARRRGSRIG